jgi:CheY-like chemotaxis protein
MMCHGTADDPPAKVRRALVVEDDPQQRRYLTHMLRCWGFEVSEAADGAVALERLSEFRGQFAVVLLDIMLPLVDGIEVARRALSQYPDLSIVACSAVLQGDIEERLRSLGVRGFLPKPFTAQSLFEVVQTFAIRLSEDSRSPSQREGRGGPVEIGFP